MAQRSVDAAAIEAEVNQIRSLGIDALRQRWRMMFGAIPPKRLGKDIIGRMIAYRIQEEAFGGLDRDTVKLLDRLAHGEKTSELNRRLKPGTVLIREYDGKRHTVTVVPEGFLWEDTIHPSLSAIAQAITGTKWNGPRFFGLRGPKDSIEQEERDSRRQPSNPSRDNRRSVSVSEPRSRKGGRRG